MDDEHDSSRRLAMRRRGSVRIIDGTARTAMPGRRTFLRRVAAGGAALPAACFFLQQPASAHVASAPSVEARGTRRSAAGARHIIRDFADPYLELIRLLREASEIEHALMLQYLYGAFSLKPAYGRIAGAGAPGSDDLIGVAIQEMQHLRQVNDLLVALGGTPNLIRQDFPYEPELYPFEFNLEPLTPSSLAKYVYTEAPAGSLDPRRATDPAERRFLRQLDKTLGGKVKPNHVGSLYDAILRTLGEYIAASPAEAGKLRPWTAKLDAIKREGEVEHYAFFKRLFTATHEGFRGRRDVWALPRSHPDYPSLSLPVNPSAFVGRDNQIEDPAALSLAWLGNLHYWITLLLAHLAYVERTEEYVALAKAQMLGPFWSIARHLPTLGAGMPCEPLNTGYVPCGNGRDSLKYVICMVTEADRLARSVKGILPASYPLSLPEYMVGTLTRRQTEYGRGNVRA